MSFKPTLVHGFQRIKLMIAYSVLVVLMMISLSMMYGVVQDQEVAQERHQLTNCRANNETRAILEMLLRELAKPRENDEAGEHEERKELLESLLPYLERRDCEEEVESVYHRERP